MMDELGFLECSSSALSLLPRTLGFFSSETGAAPFEQQDYAIESFFKTVASNHSKDCLEQAKVILNGSTALPIMFPGNGETGSVKNGKDHPQERRPALGRKRARFSMMPSTSPSLGNLDFEKLDMKSSTLTDPEEFFSYQEKLENADREVKKLLGRGAVSTDLTQQHQTATRQRRPGILGKTAKYKPPVLLHADDVEIVVLSQEKVTEKGASIPCKIAIDTEPHNFSYLSNQSDISHELGTVTRSVADGDKGENLLDTLLSSMKGLDEDEEVAFLQKRLQFKPVIVDKLRLPELNRDQRDDVGGAKRKEIVQKVGGSLFSYSPTLSRKPLATISLLQRHFSQGDPPQDPHACAGDFSLIEGRDENSLSPAANVNQPDTRILNSEGDTTLVKKNGRRSNSMANWPSSITEPNKTAHSRIVMEEMLTRDSPCSLDLKTDHNPIRFDSNNHVSSPGSDGCSEDKVNEMLQEAPTSQAQDGLEDQLSPVAGTNLPMDARSEKFSTSPEQHDELIPVVGTNLPMDARSEKFSTSPEQHDEELQRDSGVSMITQLQPKAPRNKQRPNIRRKSLTEAGTRWEAGVRRSTRIKTRPLEHWRGEKLLYGRIHDSLTTVIGIKYASPCKGGGTQVLKVKSYVHEKYAELVEQAAMH